MLTANGKKVDKTDKTDPFVKYYNECMSALKGIRDDNKLLFESPARKISTNQEGKRENSAGGWGLYREKLIVGNVEYDVQYYETSFPDVKSGAETFRPRRYSFNGSLDTILLDQDPDKAFFLVFISRHCEIMPDLEGLQNKLKRDNRNIYWKVRNEKAESKSRNEFKRWILKVENAIFDVDEGPSVDDLRIIAKNFKIGNVDRLDPNQLRDVLADTVLVKDANGKYDKKKIDLFIELLPKKGQKKMSENATIPALAVDLQTHKIVEHKRIQGNKFAWMCGDQQLCAHTPSMKADEVLIDYLEKNEDERKTLEEKVKELTK